MALPGSPRRIRSGKACVSMSETESALSTGPRQRHSAVVEAEAGLVIGVLVVGAFVMILNETIVSVALPDLSRILSVTPSTVQWLTSGFLLMMAVVIPTTGFLLERFTPPTGMSPVNESTLI